jgi:CheY-like chemotaxis protein
MKRILIVEDQSDLRRLVRWSLDEGDYEFHEANNGAAGLAAAQRLRPALVLLDVMMPGEMDGLEVCRRLKADPNLGQPAVILLSARAQRSDREAGTAAGADAYLTKPFSPIELTELAKRLLQSAPKAPALRERDD